MPWDPLYYWAPGQQPIRRNSPRWALIVAGAGGALLLALISFVAVRSASTSTPAASTPAASTPAASTPAASTPATNQLTVDQLRAGDCLAGSNLGLGSSNPWPDFVTRVACTQPHEAEVFFAGNVWSQSQADPGDKARGDQAHARCVAAFAAYDGMDYSASALSFDTIFDHDWASGDREVECVAYEPSPSGPSGGEPVDYSIKGTKT